MRRRRKYVKRHKSARLSTRKEKDFLSPGSCDSLVVFLYPKNMGKFNFTKISSLLNAWERTWNLIKS